MHEHCGVTFLLRKTKFFVSNVVLCGFLIFFLSRKNGDCLEHIKLLILFPPPSSVVAAVNFLSKA